MTRDVDEQRLALALDAAAASTWDHDVAGRCVHLDARWGDIIGGELRARTVATRRLYAIVHPVDRSAATRQVRACYLGRESQFRVQYRVRHTNGEWIWLLCRGRVVEWDAAGRARRMIGINTDITEQKRAEERLHRHVQFLTQVQTSTVELLDRHDQASLLQEIVNRAEGMFGAQGATLALLENDELVYRVCTPGAAFLQGLRLGRSQPLLGWRAIDTREPVAANEYAKLPEEERFPGSRSVQACAVFPIVTGEVVIGVLGISRDDPGRGFTPDELQMGRLFAQIGALLLRNAGIYDEAVRLAEARTTALRESEERYRTLIEMSGDAVFLVDLTGRIRTANATAARMHGFTVDELTAMRISELDTPESARLAPGRLARLLAGEAMTFEVTHRRKDGSVFPLDVIASAVRINNENFVLAFDRDITARKAVEDRRVLLEASLRESKKMESLGTLAGGVAHDFNNLLTGMCGYVEIARERLPAGHAGRKWLEQTLELGNHARDLIRQILTFSQQTISEIRPLDLSTVVAGVQNLSRFTLPAGAQLRSQLDTDCPPIAADQTQLHQVVLNLCTNASHALPAVGGQITLSVANGSLPERLAAAQPALADRPLVRLSVADNGCGMDAATLERIFEPFFTTKESGKGTGLGLAVVHGIVGAHGGVIDVRSQPGAGTTFDIFFPALPVSAHPFPAKPEARPARGHQEAILWVDDNDATGEVIAHLLGLLNYQVTHLKVGAEALAAFTAAPNSYAMLITDLAMPGLDGEALARAAREVRPDLPVLVVTGMIEPTRQATLREAGIREIIFKPVTLIELGLVVARHLPTSAAEP